MVCVTEERQGQSLQSAVTEDHEDFKLDLSHPVFVHPRVVFNSEAFVTAPWASVMSTAACIHGQASDLYLALNFSSQ